MTNTTTGPKDVEAEGRIAGRYVRLEQLGAGGMGTVHRARDEATGQFVAFKQLVSSLAGGRRRTAEALFEREYHTLVRLKHPRIIEVYDYGLTETGPYYTMELLDGRDMNELGIILYRDVCRILRDVASSLALIHARRLVHRDVSPRKSGSRRTVSRSSSTSVPWRHSESPRTLSGRRFAWLRRRGLLDPAR
jgi:hypothetical protein